jgi:beta-glucanase (GH16 family)
MRDIILKHAFVVGIFLTCLPQFLHGREDQPPDAPDIPVEGYALVWADEFDGDKLDRSKWDYRSLGRRRDAINVREAVSLDGEGTLVITTSHVDEEYHTGMIATQGLFEPTYGYFECRAKLQEQTGHWSAFWLQTPTMGRPIGNPAVSGTEVDIFEYMTKWDNEMVHNLHWDGYGRDHQTAGTRTSAEGISSGWHTFGLLWTENSYVFYVDGKETWRTSEGISKRSEYIILSLEVGDWADDIADAELPDSFYVDYVRVYQEIK